MKELLEKLASETWFRGYSLSSFRLIVYVDRKLRDRAPSLPEDVDGLPIVICWRGSGEQAC